MSHLRRHIWYIAPLLLLLQTAQAHPEGFSGLRIDVADHSVHAVLTLHTRDMTRWFPPRRYPNYVADVCAALSSRPSELLEISGDDTDIAASNVRAGQRDVGLLQIDFDFLLPATARSIQIWSRHLPMLPSGHQQLLTVQRGSDVLLEDTLTVEHDSATLELAQLGSNAPPLLHPSRTSFFLLGIQHIVTGYDHLLFLAALLLVCRSFREAASIITFFTVAHSITLSLAALDLVRIPSRIVEPAIAASIVYVALENLFGKHRFAWRAGVTFGFGLVHGLGFASALRDVGLGQSVVGVATPLLKFSIGLETGQLCIAAMLLQALLLLRKSKGIANEPKWVPVGSSAVALIGAYWLVSRVMAG